MVNSALKVNNLMDLPLGKWVSNETMKLNGGLRHGELAVVSGGIPARSSTFNFCTAMKYRDFALSFPPCTPERYDAVAAYYSYGNFFVVKQEAPGARPTIGWMDWEGGCPDFGDDIKFMLEGVKPEVDNSIARKLTEGFAEAIAMAKKGGKMITIDSISKQ